MELDSFQSTLQWIIHYGYFFMFGAMMVEGQIVTMAGAFGAALGYFNIPMVFILSLSADVITDAIYYSVGFWGRKSFVQRFGHRFGLSDTRIEKITTLVKTHAKKTLIAIKLTPIVSTPGLIIVGYTGMDMKKFLWLCLLISIPKSIILIILGYYFSLTYFAIVNQLHDTVLATIGIIFIIIVVYILYQKISKKVAQKIETL